MKLLAFRCGSCGCVIGVPASGGNGQVRCGNCGQALKVPLQAPEVPLEMINGGKSVRPAGALAGQVSATTSTTTEEFVLPIYEAAEPSPTPVRQDTRLADAAGVGISESGCLQLVSPAPANEAAIPAPIGAEPQGEIASDQGSPAVAGPEASQAWAEDFLPTGVQESRRAKPIATPPSRRIPFSFWLLAVLIPTTVTFMALSIILFRLWLDERDKKARHPLEDLPEAVEATSDAGGRPRVVVNPTQSPPELSVIRLGESKRYDGLEVTPLRIRLQHVIYARTQDGRTQVRHPDPMLVLYLRLRNVTDHVFQPLDPIFNVAWREGRAVYTFVSVGEERFYGPVQDAALERIAGQDFSEIWPAAKNAGDGESAQANDRQVLETIVLAYQTRAKRRITDALERLPADTTLRWHVQLRKGRQDRLIKQKPHRLWLTTVVPVEFRVDQIERESPAASRQQ